MRIFAVIATLSLVVSAIAKDFFPDIRQLMRADKSSSELVIPSCPFNHINAPVLHLGVLHWVPGMEQQEKAVDLVSKSQFDVVRFVRNHSDYVYFQESLTVDLAPEGRAKLEAVPESAYQVAKILFPKGTPRFLDGFNVAQKTFLAQNGALRTLYYLGELKNVYRSIDGDLAQRLDEKVEKRAAEVGGLAEGLRKRDAVIMDLVVTQREAAAERIVAEHLQKNPKAKVVLVFGMAHDLRTSMKSLAVDYADPCPETRLVMLDTPQASGAAELPSALTEGSQLKIGRVEELRDFASFHRDHESALLYYGNFKYDAKDRATFKKIITEEAKILDFIRDQKMQIPAYLVQHLITPYLKKRSLELVNPRSINADFPLSSLRRISQETPMLREAFEVWVKKHGL